METAVRTRDGGGWDDPPHFDRLRWKKGERGSRGEMRRLRAKPKVPVVVGMDGGGTLGLSSQGIGDLSNPAHY
jgi:hypothetical protein